jgi:hypothetical protein
VKERRVPAAKMVPRRRGGPPKLDGCRIAADAGVQI